jgi:uncharacterized protein YlxP (DUF503 family)
VFVGVLRVRLSIPGARSLKDKRRVVLSFKERLAAKLRVSVAEVGDLDNPGLSTLGIAVVSNEAAQCDRVLEEAAHAAGTLANAILVDRSTEIIPMGTLQNDITKTRLHDPAEDDPEEDAEP